MGAMLVRTGREAHKKAWELNPTRPSLCGDGPVQKGAVKDFSEGTERVRVAAADLALTTRSAAAWAHRQDILNQELALVTKYQIQWAELAEKAETRFEQEKKLFSNLLQVKAEPDKVQAQEAGKAELDLLTTSIGSMEGIVSEAKKRKSISSQLALITEAHWEKQGKAVWGEGGNLALYKPKLHQFPPIFMDK